MTTPKKGSIWNVFSEWANEKVVGLFILNLVIIILVLLRSAGYFSPFFLISISFIVFVFLILSVFLIGVNSRILFCIAIVLWILAGFFRMLYIDIWAERVAIYVYQSLFLGVLVGLFARSKK